MLRAVREKWTLEGIFLEMANACGITLDEIKNRSRSALSSECRKKIAYICCRLLQFPVSEVATYLGVSGPAVSWAIKEGSNLLKDGEADKFTILPPG